MRGASSRLIGDSGGAVASTVALSLFALIAVGGVAFDYARMASLDTELQNAADQAALAGVSQLDGKAGRLCAARRRRQRADHQSHADGQRRRRQRTAIADPAEDRMRRDRVDPILPGPGRRPTAATSDVNAKFLRSVGRPARAAFYALTPIVAAFTSGQLNATAFAGLGGAICSVPPLMLCNPKEATDPTFTLANYVGKGIRLSRQ